MKERTNFIDFSVVLRSLVISMFFMFVSCSSEKDIDEELLTNMPNLRVEASILSNDKIDSRYSGTSLNSLSFTQNDSICIFMNSEKLCKWIYNGNKWTPTNQAIWKDTTNTHHFHSFYPYNDKCTFDSIYGPSLIDQDGTFENLKKYDLLIADKQTSYKSSGGTISFTNENSFKHLLSLIKLNIVGTGEFANATIHSIKLSSPRLFSRVIYSFEDQSFKIDSSDDIHEITINPNHVMVDTQKAFYFIAPPRETDSKINLSIVYSNSKESNIEKKASLSDNNLTSGLIYNYNLHLKDGKIEIEMPQIKSWEEADNIQDIYL